MSIDFIHLHNHSEYSPLDAVPKVEEYLIRSADLGFKGLALTEHGNLRSMFQLQKKSTGKFTFRGEDYDFEPIKPIFGIEFYVAPLGHERRGMPNKDKEIIKNINKHKTKAEIKKAVNTAEKEVGYTQRYHLLVFVKNKIGLKNLFKLCHMSWYDGFYYKPRIDMELLKYYHEGLIVTTSCVGGEIPQLLIDNQWEKIETWLKGMKKIFKDDLYLEIQPHNIKNQIIANNKLMDISDEFKIKVIATNDCHYIQKEDLDTHHVLLDIQTGGANKEEEDKFRFEGDDSFYMKCKEDMYLEFKKYHKSITDLEIRMALENTMEIYEKCNVKLDVDKKKGLLPSIEIPSKHQSERDFFIYLVKKGWNWRKMQTKVGKFAEMNNITEDQSRQIYLDRLKMEIKRITDLNFINYFLMIYEIVSWARENDIMVGPGRGSSAGSLVSYLLGITSIDPIRYNLLFDRFLGADRIDFPDIDMDFQDNKRSMIFDHIYDKYGKENVCQIGTFGKMKGKQALLDVARVKKVQAQETFAVTKHIIDTFKGDARADMTIIDSFSQFDFCKEYHKKHPDVKPHAVKLEGRIKYVGVHPAGIQVAPYPIDQIVPIEYRKTGEKMIKVSAFDWEECQGLGLVKIDVLGLKTLSIIKQVLKSIEETPSGNCEKIKVVHCKKEDYDIYIGRPGKWGNPFTHIVDKKTLAKYICKTREESIIKYKEWIKYGEGKYLLKDIHELEGKILGCWCKPKSCHGDILKSIEETPSGKKINLEEIDLENKEVLDKFTNTEFEGIFQFDSIGMKTECQEMVFDQFLDIVAMNALYRPGATQSGALKKFVNRKAGKEKIVKIHPIYDEITKDTQGIVVYQEQFIKLFVELGSYTPIEADKVRKIMAKSIGVEAVREEKQKFAESAIKKGMQPKAVDKLFKSIENFGKYGFNKAHAAAYSVIAYWCMYLKYHYPLEFWFSLLKYENDMLEVSRFISIARKDVDINMPDINYSKQKFSISGGVIIGLSNIKGVGDKAADEIVRNGDYHSLWDMCQKVNRRIVHRGVINALVRAGAFRSIYSDIGALLIKLEEDKYVWEMMLELDEYEGENLYASYVGVNTLDELQEAKIMDKVCPIPSRLHKIQYYRWIEKKFRSSIDVVKLVNVKEEHVSVTVLGLIVDIKYSRVGDNDDPERFTLEQKKLKHWGSRIVKINLEDETGTYRTYIDDRSYLTFKHIIDKGERTPVIIRGVAFGDKIYTYIIADLEELEENLYGEDDFIDKYKRCKPFERYFFYHPVKHFRKEFSSEKYEYIRDLRKNEVIGIFFVVGLIIRIKRHLTKKDELMAFIDIEDESGEIVSVIAWPETIEKNEDTFIEGNIIAAKIDFTKTGNFFKNIRFIKKMYDFIR